MTLAYLMQPTAWLILIVVFIVLFGARLPDAMKNLGASFSSFKKGMKEGEEEAEEEKKLKN